MRSTGWMRSAVAGIVVLALSLFGFAATASAAVSIGHSGWTWGDPRPQGNALGGLDFAGGRGYASGEFGTLLRTDDSGANWTGIATGITDPLVRVRAVNANTVVIGGRCALRRSDDGGQSFNRLPWTASDRSCPSQITSFQFPNPLTGYLLTEDGSVLRTADGGQTFSRRTSVPGTASAGGSVKPTDIFFVDDNTGVAITAAGKIFRTTDGGNSWTDVETQGVSLNGLFFIDPLIGYAVGGDSTLLRTADGGATWDKATLTGAPPGLALTSLDCADANTCLITESTGARLVRTIDAGANGESISPSTQAIVAAAFASPTRAVAVGAGGATVVSDNGGTTWSPVGGKISGSAFGPVRASSPRLAWSGGEDGALARTIDGGETWFTVGVPTTVAVRDATFLSETLGYALDAVGGTFKTANGGGSWTILNTGTSEAPTAILALDPNQVLLAGPRGVRRSIDGGGSFTAVSDKDIRNAPITGVDSVGNAVVAYGPASLAISSDGGGAWTKVKLPAKRIQPADAELVDGALYLMTSDGRVWRTANRGKKWTDLPAVGTSQGSQISFSSQSAGYLTVNKPIGGSAPVGFSYRTTDGGQTWAPQLVSQQPITVFDAGQTGFAGTAAGAFFGTTAGGQAGTPTNLTLAATKGQPDDDQRAKAVEIRIGGQLNPPEGAEEIDIAVRSVKGSRWQTQTVTAATNGEFTASYRASEPFYVVAQWRGDDDRAGSGSKALLVKPPKKKKKKPKADHAAPEFLKGSG